ncbi:hypothetical protein CAL7716_057250 [Calothrix sp. PCC 7716]|nr:hypothetical protein CAL7716_057250 [Calothrix sp. PCC 7716]
MTNTPLLNIAGAVSISSLTCSCVIGGGGFLSAALQINAFLFGVSYCYYDNRNPIKILGDLRLRVSELNRLRAQLTSECDELQQNKGALATLDEIEKLISQKEAELKKVEKSYRVRWSEKEEELNKRGAQIEQFLDNEQFRINRELETRNMELDQREAFIIQEQEKIEAELEEDKQNFLKHQQAEIGAYKDEIALLRSQLAEAEAEITRYEFPRMPEGVNREDVAARRVIEILRDCKLICDFRGAWIEDGFVIVRVRPRRGGEKEVSKWANRIHIELNLVSPPEVSTQQGAVQLRMAPQEMVSLPLVNPKSPSPEPDGDLEEALHSFVEPRLVLDPHGPIRPLERRWVLWLWNYCSPQVRNKKNVIRRVWGATNGAKPEKFRAARERLHKILDDAGIPYRTQGDKRNEG